MRQKKENKDEHEEKIGSKEKSLSFLMVKFAKVLSGFFLHNINGIHFKKCLISMLQRERLASDDMTTLCLITYSLIYKSEDSHATGARTSFGVCVGV